MEYVEILRMFERLIITSFGGIAIFLGYRLFKSGILNIADAQWDGLGIKLKITKASPGIFFCAFGAFILVSSLQEKVLLSKSNPNNTVSENSISKVISVKRKFLGVLNDNNWDIIISSINSTISVFEEYEIIGEIEKLESVKTDILYNAFGEDDFNFYKKHISTNLAELDGAARARWFTLNRRAMKKIAIKEVDK